MLFLAGKERGPFGEQSAFLPVQPGERAQGMYSHSCEVWAGCLPSHLFYCWPQNGETRLGWATFWLHLRLAFGINLAGPARRHWNISKDIKQGAKISWSIGTEITESVLLPLWNYVRNQYQKISENNPHVFKCNVNDTFLKTPHSVFLSSLQLLNKPYHLLSSFLFLGLPTLYKHAGRLLCRKQDLPKEQHLKSSPQPVQLLPGSSAPSVVQVNYIYIVVSQRPQFCIFLR